MVGSTHHTLNPVNYIPMVSIGVARGGHGRAFALPSKPSSYLNINCTYTTRSFFITYLRVVALARGWLVNEL